LLNCRRQLEPNDVKKGLLLLYFRARQGYLAIAPARVSAADP